MSQKKSNQHDFEDISHVPYESFSLFNIKWLLLYFIIFLFGILFTFPLSKTLESFINNEVSSEACPINSQGLDIDMFLPKVSISKLTLGKSCGDFNKSLEISNIKAHFTGISFAPFGLSFSLEMNLFKKKISGYLVRGLLQNHISLHHKKFSLEPLSDYIPYHLKLRGDLDFDIDIEIGSQKISSGGIHLVSSNFIIPSQEINGGIILPSLPFNSMQVHIDITAQDFILNKSYLGNLDSPIQLKLQGTIGNKSPMGQAPIDIAAPLAVSDELKANLFFLENMLQVYPKKDNYYQLSIHGTVQNPEFKPIN